MYWLMDMSKWTFEPDSEIERGWRMIAIDLTLPLHVFGAIWLMFYFKILPL